MLKAVSKIGAGTIGAMLATFVGMPVLTRVYDPEVYSAWMVYFSAWVIFSTIATLRLELAVVLPEPQEKQKAASLWIACLISSVCVGLLSWGIVYIAAESILGRFHQDLKQYCPLLALWVCATGCFQASMGWFTRNKMFGWYGLGQFAVPVMTIGLQVGLAQFEQKGLRELISGAVFSHVMIAVVTTLVVFIKFRKDILQSDAWKGIGSVVRDYQVYPSYMTAYSLIATIRDRFVYFLIGNYAMKSSAAYFGLAQRFINVPNRLASSALRPVYFQRSATLGFKNIENEVYFLLFLITALVVPPWIVVILHADNLFALAFGEAWRSAGYYGVLLSIPAIPLLIGNWLDRGYDALGKQRVGFWLEMVFSGLSVGALCVCVFGYGDIQKGIIAQVCVLTVYYWVWLWVLLRLGEYSMQRFRKLVFLYLGLSTVYLGIGYLIKNALPWFGAVILSLIVFYAPVIIFAFRNRGNILRVLKKS